MSQTKQWSADLGNTTRNPTASSSGNEGSGNNQRFFVGRYGAYDYDGFVRFALDWTNVGKIVNATLSVYTDDGFSGIMPATTTETPTVVFKRLTAAFSEGVGPSASFQANDYTAPSSTTSSQKTVLINRASNGVTNIDVTDYVELWAPKTVKTRTGASGAAYPNYGIGLFGHDATNENIGLWSEDASDSSMRPFITLTYEYGTTIPDMPIGLSPSGVVAGLSTFDGAFSDLDPSDLLGASEVEVYTADVAGTASAATNRVTKTAHGLVAGDIIYFSVLTGGAGLLLLTPYYVISPAANDFLVSRTLNGAQVDITTNYTALSYVHRLYAVKQSATATEIANARFTHDPVGLHLNVNTTYQWRGRVYDNEAQVSAYTALTSFSFTNNAPSAPVLSPVSGGSYATLDGVLFGSNTFVDTENDGLLAYQVQMSAYPQGDARWDDGEFILWDTGKTYVALVTDGTGFKTVYGGAPLVAGTYYWRARVWDGQQGVSGYTYATITVTASYAPEPDGTQTAIQLRPKAPWRIVIKAMGALRGPGTTVAVLEDAKNVGASILYNSPGELHFTLPKDHPQISVIEPKQTHYSLQFRQGDGWREVFAGLMWDFDASDTDVVFYGIDYLALYDYTLDERYDQSNPDKPSESGGSKYVTAGKNSIGYIVQDQLTRAKNLANSPVGFITVNQSSATLAALLTETLVVFSTYAPTLGFVTGLLDSHRAGQGKKTRVQVRQKTGGGYEVVVQDDPGVVRNNLRMRYGELVQGYRVIAFGTEWASRVSAIGRAKDGIQVLYKTATAPGINEATWGHFAQVRLIDGVSDANDLQRRTRQAAVHAGKLGKSVALGLRSGILQPRDGYDLCDAFPIDIEDGSVDTGQFGSGYWIAMGITWECAAQNGKQTTTLTLQPREDDTPPSGDLLTLQEISPQHEWQIGWTPPPVATSATHWLDQSTGKSYTLTAGAVRHTGITGTI